MWVSIRFLNDSNTFLLFTILYSRCKLQTLLLTPWILQLLSTDLESICFLCYCSNRILKVSPGSVVTQGILNTFKGLKSYNWFYPFVQSSLLSVAVPGVECYYFPNSPPSPTKQSKRKYSQMYFNSYGAHLNRYSGVPYDMLIQVSFDRNDLHQQIMNKVLEGVLLAASCGKTLPARIHRKMSYRLDPFIYSSDRLLLSAFHCCWFVKKFINNNNNDGWKKQAMTGKIKPTAKKL